MTSTIPETGSVSASPTPKPTRMRLMTLPGLRVFASLTVFMDHSLLPLPGINPFADEEFGNGLEAVFRVAAFGCVSFFFVLSGFLLTWLAKPTDTYRGFLRRRLVRIYPGHLVTLLICLLGMGATLWQVLPNIFLVQSWVPRYNIWAALNGSTWSLACEIPFYVAFPWILKQVNKIAPSRLWWWVGGIVVTVLAITSISHFLVPNTPQFPFASPIGMNQFWMVYTAPPARMLDFLLGMIMCRIIKTNRWINLGLLPAVGIYVAAGGLGLLLPFTYELAFVEILPAALLVAAAAATDVHHRRSLLRGRVWAKLGDMSYAFYLVHGLVVFGGGTLLRNGKLFSIPAAFGIIAVDLLVSLGLAWLLYTFVEKPIRARWAVARPKKPVTS
ncbi:acyltransferase family protein [Amycolatopsis sp. H20-H5]|uniref:acyltransferase family protein n=1 Tax=Amycolatopsis sp. H20-H5 TaxID=3046309 RepID=UPI002DBA2CFE|nr:acyltransferase [Amycolatopsis sp. H20-H5]MEC3974267.1 acyltransferase [Amycolatopsis sp. H20-H5]